jgi:hypothetical protein
MICHGKVEARPSPTPCEERFRRVWAEDAELKPLFAGLFPANKAATAILTDWRETGPIPPFARDPDGILLRPILFRLRRMA